MRRGVDSLWVVILAARMQSRALRGSPFVVILGVAQPVALFVVATTPFVPPRPEVAGRAFVSVLLTSMWAATIWTAGTILRAERRQGTLAALVRGTGPPWLVLLGKSLGATLHMLVPVFVSTAAAVVVLRLIPPLPQGAASLVWTGIGVVLVIAAGTATGMLLSCLFLVSRHAAEWSSALMYPVFLLGGLLVPTSLLPSAARWLSSSIPHYWAHRYLTAVVSAQPPITALLVLSGVTTAYLTASAFAFQRLIHVARRNGTIDLA
jgi:ABC-2 type transport system permease protein